MFDKFPKITYAEAMLKYGSDKPDLRNPLIINFVYSAFVKLLFQNGIFSIDRRIIKQNYWSMDQCSSCKRNYFKNDRHFENP